MEVETSPHDNRFETSQVQADFLVSSPLVLDSWKVSSLTYGGGAGPVNFVVEQVGDVGYIGFSAVQSVTVLNLDENHLVRIDGGVFSHFGVEDDDPPMVLSGFLQLFLAVYNNEDFQHKVLGIMEKCKSIVFTGHSIGGAIASLAALWLMPLLTRDYSVISVTFGSPLLGNESLAKSVLRKHWGGNFINVVSKHDIVPRLLFAPLTLVAPQLNWLLSITPHFRHCTSQLPENEVHSFHRYILGHVAATASIQYKPFGSFLFCFENGAICIDNKEVVVKMLRLMFMDSSAHSSINDHLNYEDIIMQVSHRSMTRRGFPDGTQFSDSSYNTGISLALAAAGLDSVSQQARECLMEARVTFCPSVNSSKLSINLAKVTPNRAQIEWYKACCDDSDDQMGYYDAFKQKVASRKVTEVNMSRIKLATFWNKVVTMVENNQLHHDFDKRGKWINASQFYKTLVEPLDIAHYYKSGMHLTKGHYMKHGRERRYEIFDKWWSERDQVDGKESYKRNDFAGLTQDSCFWARVEEANEWVKNVRTERDPQKLAAIWENINSFELYASRLVENKEVSKDVVAKNSSYSIWKEELKVLKAQFMQMPPRFSGFLGGGVLGGEMVP